MSGQCMQMLREDPLHVRVCQGGMGGGEVAYWGAKGWVVCFWRGDRVVVEMGGGGDGGGGGPFFFFSRRPRCPFPPPPRSGPPAAGSTPRRS